jgi:hypothetical protein
MDDDKPATIHVLAVRLRPDVDYISFDEIDAACDCGHTWTASRWVKSRALVTVQGAVKLRCPSCGLQATFLNGPLITLAGR